MKPATVHFPDVLKRSTITVKITGHRKYSLRLAIGSWLMKVAGKVIGAATVAISVEFQP